MILNVATLRPRKTSTLGATLGENHMEGVRAAMAAQTLQPGSLLLFDFDGVEAVNGSYIKATVYWSFLCGQLSAPNRPAEIFTRHEVDPRPHDVYVTVANLNPDVREEIVDFFRSRQFPLVVATKWSESGVAAAVIEGHLDNALRTTLSALVQERTATAPMLHAKYPGEQITVTAWNNRLTDLHALRLVRRRRNGRVLEYEPLARQMTYGRSIH